MSEEMWINGQGHHIPASMVSDADRMKDELVKRLHAEADLVQTAMRHFKERAFGEVNAAKDLIFDKYGAKVGGPKGNFTLTTFDGGMSVEVKVQDRIGFGPELQAAKALIDECIEAWAEGASDNIRALVEHAFQVNKAGRIDTARVLSLRKLTMKTASGEPDPKWQIAMQAITDALLVHGTATYINFKEQDERGAMASKVLDFASL